MSKSNINIIRHDELEEIDTNLIGNGVFGNCFFKKIQTTWN